MKATPEQIAVVEKRIENCEKMLDEFVVQDDNLTSLGKAKRDTLEQEVAALTAILDEIKALRELNSASDSWEVEWYKVGQNLVSNRASREVCFRRGFTLGTQWVLRECASILALKETTK